MKTLNRALLFALTCLITFSACSDDNDPDPKPVIPEGEEWAVYLKLDKSRDENESEYILPGVDLMQGAISAEGQGYEILGWNFVRSVGKTLFVSGYGDNKCNSYQVDATKAVKKMASFTFDNALEMFGHTKDRQYMLAMETNRTGYDNSLLYIVDPITGENKQKISLELFVDKEAGTKSLPSALVVRGDKLFVPLHIVDAKGGYTYPDPNAAHVAIFPFPNVTDKPEKIIKDTRTSPIGVNGATSSIIEADNGNLYSFSCGTLSSGIDPASSKPSGLLRINKGATEFDKDYFFNIEEKTNGGKIFWMDYAGDNKAIARILVKEMDPDTPWAAFGREVFHQRLVILDLEAKTVTNVANVPLHAKRYTSPVLVENGKVYVSVETAEDAHIYQVDVASATAVKGAKIEGKTIKGFFKL
ncbi:hypothetical protein FUAX_49610 (plasmid) [Fulvitalea axinellae]|uniref:DUF4374 domain-containing protein n=1 Tax=Fulvitalea axinellae TaxID=1182444 RepID=A0AAU9DDI8_9BACT|nr:hypothetical protein FUAX_49610 [Fulvitalea axinellae]